MTTRSAEIQAFRCSVENECYNIITFPVVVRDSCTAQLLHRTACTIHAVEGCHRSAFALQPYIVLHSCSTMIDPKAIASTLIGNSQHIATAATATVEYIVQLNSAEQCPCTLSMLFYYYYYTIKLCNFEVILIKGCYV